MINCIVKNINNDLISEQNRLMYQIESDIFNMMLFGDFLQRECNEILMVEEGTMKNFKEKCELLTYLQEKSYVEDFDEKDYSILRVNYLMMKMPILELLLQKL